MAKELFSLFAVFISLFLFGITIMRTGLLNLGQQKVKEYLIQMVDTPFKGLLIGTIITAILQSSSAVMVITVGFVAAGYLNFRQSIGLILGTNIGTCLTTELIALNLSFFIFPMLFIGFLLLFIPKLWAYCLGCVSFGLGCVFIAMNGLETLAYPLASLPFTHPLFTLTNEHELIGVGIGVIIAAIIQSSTATTAIAMGFMNEHILSLTAGIAIMLGSNIGTGFTAFLASIGSVKSARLVAFAHIWLNIIGVVLFFPLIGLFSSFVSTLASLPSTQLAHASTLFNMICSILMLPFINRFASFIEIIHGQKR
ncbi:Na/Pi symporter [Halalkalibacterium ligniniphilum]|uniref:Na/Pi symporter n=1 Tax=Halalkalibacterium ligniniphilum TaxID=1134413 RepID=UPI0003458DF0|nr:Na/Pi symporter [Halalkalibacterium ligniniphilum]